MLDAETEFSRLGEEKGKKRAIIVVALITACLGISLTAEGFKAEMADLKAELYCYTTSFGFYSKQREGMIHIRGWIYNYGSRDLNVTVHLWVTDGTKNGGGMGSSQSEFWQSYYVPLGIISKSGGSKWFEWDQRYNPFDPTTARFTYDLIPLALARGGP